MTSAMTEKPAKTRICGAEKRSGGPCTRPAGWGTTHPGAGRCKLHTGATPTGRKVAAREQAAEVVAHAIETGWHIAVDVDPLDGLLDVIRNTAGQVAHATALVEREAQDRAAKGIDETAQKETFALQMLRDSQAELAKYCKMALDTGIAERKVRLAERTGALVAAAFEDVMAERPELFDTETRAWLGRRLTERLAVLERMDADQIEAGA